MFKSPVTTSLVLVLATFMVFLKAISCTIRTLTTTFYSRSARVFVFQIKLGSFGGTNITRFCGSGGALESNTTCVFTVLDLEEVKKCVLHSVLGAKQHPGPRCSCLDSADTACGRTKGRHGQDLCSNPSRCRGLIEAPRCRLIFGCLAPTGFRENDTPGYQ